MPKKSGRNIGPESASAELGRKIEELKHDVHYLTECLKDHKAAIERVRELPLILTDDEESCIVMRAMIERAIKGEPTT